MKHSIFILLAGTFLIIGPFISCRGKVTISGDNGTDTIVLNWRQTTWGGGKLVFKRQSGGGAG